MNRNVEHSVAEEHHHQRRSYFVAGASLVVSSVLTLALALHHPHIHTTGSDFADFQAQLASIESSSAWVHGLLIVMLIVFTCCQYWLRKAHAANRFMSLIGFGFFASGATFAAAAATTSGFVLPKFVAGIDSADPTQTVTGQQIIQVLNDARDVFHHFSVVAMIVGIMCLACSLFAARRHVGKVVSGVALAVGCLACIALVTHHMPPTVHGVIVFAAVVSLWNLVAATILIRRSRRIDVTS